MKVELLSGHDAADSVRSDIVDLRRLSYGEDEWGVTDDRSRHLLAFHRGDLIGYYRVLYWSSVEDSFDRQTISPVNSVFRFNQSEFDDYEVLEVGRLCVHEHARSIVVPRFFWRYLFDLSASFSKPVLTLGMITPPAGRECELVHDYEIARSSAPCKRTGHFQPRISGRLETDTCSAEADRDQETGSHIRLSTVRAYLSIGARFGPLARWPSFGNRLCLLTSLVPEEFNL